MMNQITIEGTVITDPFIFNGLVRPISFTLKTTQPCIDINGQPDEEEFHFKVKCSTHNPLFSFVKNCIKKNQCIRITGSLKTEEYYTDNEEAFISPDNITFLANDEIKNSLDLYKMKQEGKVVNLTSRDFIKNGFLTGYGIYKVAFSCPCCQKLFEYNSNELTFDVDATCKYCHNGFHIHAVE